MRTLSALVIVLLISVTTLPAFACRVAGPDGHIGEVTAMDPSRGTLTIKDAETGQPLHFSATVDQLKGLSLGMMVLIKHRKEAEQLKAVSIRPW